MDENKLREFINEFISKSDRLRKNGYTHISYITDTINRVLRKHFGLKSTFDPETIIKAFELLGFKQVVDFQQKWFKSSSVHEVHSTVWINVCTKDLKMLRLSLAKLPDHTNDLKRKQVCDMLERLKIFGTDNNSFLQ
jgi:hypothetical protein